MVLRAAKRSRQMISNSRYCHRQQCKDAMGESGTERTRMTIVAESTATHDFSALGCKAIAEKMRSK